MRYLLPFTVEDIARRAAALDAVGRRFVRHELKGPTSSIRNHLELLDGPLCSGQRCFIENTYRALERTVERVDALLGDGRVDVPARAAALHDDLLLLRKHFPLASRIDDRGYLVPGDKQTLRFIDSIAVTLFHSYEVQFRNDEFFDLRVDVQRFWREYSYARPEIVMAYPVLPSWGTEQDYFANAILPLIKNVLCHAYPQGFQAREKVFWVRGKQRPGCLEVSVRDHGVGVDRAVAGSLFEEGMSTQGTGHGIGLHSVREFMRDHGGGLDWVGHKVGTEFRLGIKR